MKLAVAIADNKAGPSAFVVWRGFAESMKKAAEYGYDGVELALREKKDVDCHELRTLLKRYSLEVSCISTGQVFADLRLYLTDEDPSRRNKAVEVINGLVELSGEFGGIVNLGRTRGFIPPDGTRARSTEIFLDSLSRIMPVADKNGVSIVIEPVNRYEINFINNLEQCAALLADVANPNLGIMPDVFHMNIEDASIGGALRQYGPLVKYIHFADSNRHAPGWGHLDFDEVFHALSDIGYNGWGSVEILPQPDSDSAAKQAVQFLAPYIKKYNG